MKGADKVICQAAAVFVVFALTSVPAKAQFGFGSGGGEDMMTQMAPMLEMMKAKMGKRRFAMMMQTMGPMMSRMMEGGSGMGGMMGGGGFGGMGGGIPADVGGMIPGGYGGMIPGGMGGMIPGGMGGYGGGDIMGMMGGMGGGEMMGMIPQLMRMVNVGGGRVGRRHKRR